MKNFTDTVKLFFVISGAVMGAGLLSGGELVAFFGSENLFYLVLAATVFFFGFAFADVSDNKSTQFVFLAADFVFSAAMLSGLDEIIGFAGILKGVPAASVAGIAVFHFFLSENISKVEKINLVLIPISVITVLCAAIKAPAVPMQKSGLEVGKSLNAALYACMNVFVALPPVSMATKGKTVGAKTAAALGFSVFFVIFAYIILRVSPNTSLPLLDISYKTALYPFLIVAIFIGSFTSLVCYLYPLKSFIAEKTKSKKTKVIYVMLLYVLLFSLSRVGLNVIIKYLYPLVGALGLVSIVKNIFGIKTASKDDTIKKRSALCQERRKTKSKNLPKKSTAII